MSLMTSVAVADDTTTFSDIASNVIFGASIVSEVLHAVSILMGIGFMIYSVVSFQNHRINPKMVPLDRPIIYLCLGIVLTAIPFLGQIVGHSTGEVHKKKHQHSRSAAYYEHDIDEPLDDD
jgi:hypothetical protein